MPSLVTSHSRFELSFLCDQSAKIWVYDQLSLRRTPLGQALSVGLSDFCPIESHINGEKKARQGPTLDVGLTEVSVRES